MFDFFIKNPISIDEIIEFLASALGCSSNKILATTFEKLNDPDDEIRDKIIAVSQLKHIVCYIPNDDFNGYLLTGESENPIQVYENEDIEEENTYLFNEPISTN